MSTHSVSFAPSPAALSKHFEVGEDPLFTFAFARLEDDICLVQLAQATIDRTGTRLLDVAVFRHEFASIFRYSHSACVHPLELRVFESLPDHCVRYEPDSGTVFLAKDLMAHLKRILDTAAATAVFHRTGGRPRHLRR